MILANSVSNSRGEARHLVILMSVQVVTLSRVSRYRWQQKVAGIKSESEADDVLFEERLYRRDIKDTMS